MPTKPTFGELFGARLAQLRRQKAADEGRDIEKQTVAKAVGVSKASYGRYEAGLSMPDEEIMGKLADYFGVTRSWLHYGEGQRTPAPPEEPPHRAEFAVKPHAYPVEEPSAKPRRKRGNDR